MRELNIAVLGTGRIGDGHLVRITSRDPEPPPIPYAKVSGGMAASANPLDTTTVLHDAGGGHASSLPYFFTEGYVPSYLAEWQAFVTAIREGTPSPVDGTDGRAPLVVGLAAWKSIKGQRLVLTSEIG